MGYHSRGIGLRSANPRNLQTIAAAGSAFPGEGASEWRVTLNIYVQMKSAGKRTAQRGMSNPYAKREPSLEKVPMEIPDSVTTVRELLTALVEIEVQKYNEKGQDRQMIPFLTGEEIEIQAETGKVGFGRIYSDKKADMAKACETACQCFEDGLVRVFRNQEELEGLETQVKLQEGDCLTFIRLTFLSGRLW